MPKRILVNITTRSVRKGNGDKEYVFGVFTIPDNVLGKRNGEHCQGKEQNKCEILLRTDSQISIGCTMNSVLG